MCIDQRWQEGRPFYRVEGDGDLVRGAGDNGVDPTDFDRFPFSACGITHTVYKKGSGPVVIVLHELPGLSPTSLDLGRRIADEGFTVLMPLLFGSPGQDSGKRGFVQICLAREFTLLRTNRTSKIGWLRALAKKRTTGNASRQSMAQPGGVFGCARGGSGRGRRGRRQCLSP